MSGLSGFNFKIGFRQPIGFASHTISGTEENSISQEFSDSSVALGLLGWSSLG
jgi:hypothetical protein